MSKKCTKCRIEKENSFFYSSNRSKDGLRSECKECGSKSKHSQNKPCPQCGELCWSKGGVCQSCKNNNAYEQYSKLKLGDKVYTKHKYAKYQYVRYWARAIALKLGWNKCSKCGYEKHFEVCHIKPVSSFPPETLLTEINDPSNLVALCPNCHWEFDNLNGKT